MSTPYLLRADATRRVLAAASVLFLACIAGSCSITTATARSEDERDLIRNRQRWVSAGIRDYEFDFRRICFCLPETTESVRITVRNEVITSVIRTRDGLPAGATMWAWPTVDSLFAEIQRNIDQNADRLEVEYDATYGYPRAIAVDVMEMATDDEYWVSATNLRRLP